MFGYVFIQVKPASGPAEPMAKFLCCVVFSPLARCGWLVTVSRPPGLSNLCSNFEYRVSLLLSVFGSLVRAYAIKPASGPVEPLPKFSSWKRRLFFQFTRSMHSR